MEWVEDCRRDDLADYIGAPQDGRTWIRDANCEFARAVRGGAWFQVPRLVRAARRDWSSSNTGTHYIGFRVARAVD